MQETTWDVIYGVLTLGLVLVILNSLKLDNRFYQRAFSRKLQTYIERKNKLLRKKKDETESIQEKKKAGNKKVPVK
jgi:hypothetical protein